jgi:hypothetical protein
MISGRRLAAIAALSLLGTVAPTREPTDEEAKSPPEDKPPPRYVGADFGHEPARTAKFLSESDAARIDAAKAKRERKALKLAKLQPKDI